MTFARVIEHGDVVTNVMSDNDPITEVFQEPLYRYRLFKTHEAFITGDSMNEILFKREFVTM